MGSGKSVGSGKRVGSIFFPRPRALRPPEPPPLLLLLTSSSASASAACTLSMSASRASVVRSAAVGLSAWTSCGVDGGASEKEGQVWGGAQIHQGRATPPAPSAATARPHGGSGEITYAVEGASRRPEGTRGGREAGAQRGTSFPWCVLPTCPAGRQGNLPSTHTHAHPHNTLSSPCRGRTARRSTPQTQTRRPRPGATDWRSRERARRGLAGAPPAPGLAVARRPALGGVAWGWGGEAVETEHRPSFRRFRSDERNHFFRAFYKAPPRSARKRAP